MPKIYVPRKKNLQITDHYGDCARYYYVPLIKKFYLKRVDMIVDLIECEKGRVLDIGFGSGILYYQLKERFSDLNGIDLRNDIDLVKTSLEKDNIKANLIKSDLFNLPYKDASFECIVSMSVLEHIINLESAVKEINRVLKEGGKFICGFPVKNFLMHQFFKAIKFDDEKDHPSDHRCIYEALKKNFNIERTIRFPSFLKIDHCLYMACRCGKKIYR